MELKLCLKSTFPQRNKTMQSRICILVPIGEKIILVSKCMSMETEKKQLSCSYIQREVYLPLINPRFHGWEVAQTSPFLTSIVTSVRAAGCRVSLK